MNNKELNQLHRISQVLAYDLSLSDVLQLIVSATAEMVDSKICSILLYDDNEQTLAIAATQSLSGAYKNKPPIQAGASISGRVVREKQMQVIADVSEEKSFGYSEIAKDEGLVSLLCLPMIVKGNCIGTLNSYASVKHRYTEKEIQLLSLVASQAAIAIENARLHTATAAIRDDLDKRKLIEKAKIFLMKNRKLSEPEAFRFIQKQSMNKRLPMRQIAEALVLSYDLEDEAKPVLN